MFSVLLFIYFIILFLVIFSLIITSNNTPNSPKITKARNIKKDEFDYTVGQYTKNIKK